MMELSLSLTSDTAPVSNGFKIVKLQDLQNKPANID